MALNNERLENISSESIPRLFLRFSIPAIISMSIEALYNIVDRFFVGQAVGHLGIAGITLCFPITLFIMALSMMIGVGGNTLFSIRLGAKKYRQTAIILNNSLILLLIVAFVALVFGQIFMEPLLRLFGASEETLPYAVSYLRILLFGAAFQTITPGMNHFIRSMGHPKTAMFRSLIGAGCNIIFDWLFILKWNLGMEGAAFATVLSQAIAGLFVLHFFIKKDTPIKIERRYMKLYLPYVRKIIVMGIPQSTMQFINSFMNVILNRSLVFYGAKTIYGGDMAISAFGIVNSVAMMVIMPILGFVQGAQPLIGYNYGAKEYKRVKSVIDYALGFSIATMFLAFIFIQWGAENIAAAFVKEENPLLNDLTVQAMKIYLIALPLTAMGIVSGNYFQGIGKPKTALILTLNRQVFFLIPLLLIIPLFAGLKGIFMAAPLADTVAAIVGMTLLIRHLKKMNRNQ